MNVPAPPSIALRLAVALLLVIRFSALLPAQTHETLVTTLGTTVLDTLAGINLDVNEVSPLAKHGEVDVQVISSGGQGIPIVHRVRYIPDPGFVGVDTFTVALDYLGSYPYLVYKAYRVMVLRSRVIAQQDYANTAAGTPVAIHVLANDQSSAPGPLTLSGLPVVNYGSASIQNNQILFTPQPGFTGIAHLNYVVCDALNTCKTGSATIGVSSGTPVNDSLRAATAKNIDLSMPLERSAYTLFTPPQHGVVSLSTGGRAFQYRPNANYIGSDQFVLRLNIGAQSFYKTVLLTVLNTPPVNAMAIDDYVSTPRAQSITFNVRNNDIGNLSVRSWIVPPGFPGTIGNTQPNGRVTFTPLPNFTGVATFYYKIGNLYSADIETGTVRVSVGNQSPAAPAFELTTAVATPMVIHYKVPFTGFNFSVLTTPKHGTCQYYPGNSTQTINGQTFSGYNLLIYTPQAGYNGLDSFDLRYCTTGNGDCQNTQIKVQVVSPVSAAPPYCVDNCIWTGDLNRDGIVNNRDLLPMGYVMGMEGSARPNAALEWFGQNGTDWNEPFTTLPTDLKHADADGNGRIGSADTTAIGLFYGRANALTPTVQATDKGLPFSLNLLTPNPQVGQSVEVEVILGSPTNPVTNLLGFTFDLNLSPQIRDSALRLQYDANSWLNRNSPSLWLSKTPRAGRLETAFTRTSDKTVHGYGRVAKVDFIVIDIVDGAKPNGPQMLRLQLDNPSLVWGDGHTSSGESFVLEVPLAWSGDNRSPAAPQTGLQVYPSPATDQIQVALADPQTMIEGLALHNAMGALVYESAGLQQAQGSIDVRDLPAGFYVLVVKTGRETFSQKVQIVKM